jgi:uncharacterized protein YqgC (DUF456 family)
LDAIILLWLLAAMLVVAGLAGLLLPMLPGAPLLLGGLLLAAWIEDFVYVGYGTLAVLLLLAILTYVIDFFASILGAKHFGASNRAVIGAAVGALLGLPLGLAGILIGPFVGAVLGELSHQRGLHAAGKAGLGTTIGLLLGTAVKLALGISMVGIYLMMRFL